MRVVKISNLKKDKNENCVCTVHLVSGFLWWKKEWTEIWKRIKGFNLLWIDEDGAIQDGSKVSKLWKLNSRNNNDS